MEWEARQMRDAGGVRRSCSADFGGVRVSLMAGQTVPVRLPPQKRHAGKTLDATKAQAWEQNGNQTTTEAAFTPR